jgi:MoaA/NifB/PqqE/SkfB family radical SAM enzyme
VSTRQKGSTCKRQASVPRRHGEALRLGLAASASVLLPGRYLHCLWELTYRCNATCAMCAFWRQKASGDSELTTAEVCRGLDRVSTGGCHSVNFTGGEPTLRADLEEIVAHASQCGIWTSMVSNGSLLTRERIQSLRRAGLCNLFVSLDSLDPLVHDGQRGIDGLHDRVLRVAEVLSEEFVGSHRTAGFMCVVTAQNEHDMLRIARFTDSLGLYLTVQPYHHRVPLDAGGDRLAPRRSAAAARALLDAKESLPSIFNSRGYLRIMAADSATASLGCHAGRKYFSIDPYGALHPCVDLPPAGNVLDDPLSVLCSPAARQAVAGCNGCWYCFRGESDCALTVQGFLEKAASAVAVCRRGAGRSGSTEPALPRPRSASGI